MSAKPFLWAGLAAALLTLAPMTAAVANGARHRGYGDHAPRVIHGHHAPRIVHGHHQGRFHRAPAPYRHRFGMSRHRPRPAWFGRYGGPGAAYHRRHAWRHAPYRRYYPYYPRMRHARRVFPTPAYYKAYRPLPGCRWRYSPCGYKPLYTFGYGTAFVRPIYYVGGVNFGVPIYNRPGCACY
jgi:hypothetical protein